MRDPQDSRELLGPEMEAYANGVQLQSQIYDVQIDFTLQSGADMPPRKVVRIHMSPQLAKVLGRMLRRMIREHEMHSGPIILPDALLRDLGIADEVE